MLEDLYQYTIGDTATIGCTATDDVDGSVACNYSGSVDTSTIGTYDITYVAIDTAGNTATLIVTYTVHEDYLTWDLSSYYDDAEGLDGESLILALNGIIDGQTVYPYTSSSTDVWDILRDVDEDPNNPSNIIGFYTGLSILKDCQDGSSVAEYCQMEAYGITQTVEWNREHIWSKSRGFPTESYDAYTDVHHLVAAESWMNSTKNNRFFETCDANDTNVIDRGYGNSTCNDWSFEPRDEVKGDVARMIFYMLIRYYIELDMEVMDNPMDYLLSIGEDQNSALAIYGDLEDLLIWNYNDPVSQKEIDRNEAIFGYQGNRNPFIDYEHFAELIFGDEPFYN